MISDIKSIVPAGGAAVNTGPRVPISSGRPSNPDAIRRAGDAFEELERFDKALQKGGTFSPRELLVYQMRASRLNLHVELLSRFAESVSSTVKRLHAGQ